MSLAGIQTVIRIYKEYQPVRNYSRFVRPAKHILYHFNGICNDEAEGCLRRICGKLAQYGMPFSLWAVKKQVPETLANMRKTAHNADFKAFKGSMLSDIIKPVKTAVSEAWRAGNATQDDLNKAKMHALNYLNSLEPEF